MNFLTRPINFRFAYVFLSAGLFFVGNSANSENSIQIRVSPPALKKMIKIIRSSSEQTVEKIQGLGTVWCYPDYCMLPVGKDMNLNLSLASMKQLLNLSKNKKTFKNAAGRVSCEKKFCILEFNDDRKLESDLLLPKK